MQLGLEESDTARVDVVTLAAPTTTAHVILAGAAPQILVRDNDAWLIGPRASTARKQLSSSNAIAIRFAPGALDRALHGALADVVDGVARAADVMPALRLRERAPNEHVDAIVGQLERAVTDRVRLVRIAERRIALDPATSVRALASSIGVTERTLHRAFVDVIGLAPKLFLRTRRLRRALRLVRDNRRLVDVAVAAGYFDQAHFIDDCRALTGKTPRALVDELATSSFR